VATSIREADLVEDEGALIGLAKAYLTPNSDIRRFRWLYKENPFGRARAWLAYDGVDHPIGMAALFPRKMYIGGSIQPGAVLGDFCVDPKHRTLGPALQLLRAELALANGGEFAVCYDFPSSVMTTVYKRVGLQAEANSVRLIRPLRAGKIVARIIPFSWLARPLAMVIDQLSAIAAHRPRGAVGLDFHVEGTPFASEYDDLAARVGSAWGDCTLRSAAYLNWRYRQHPYSSFEVVSARRQGELLAYCVLTTSAEGALIVDLFGIPDAAVVASLVRHVIRMLRLRGLDAISLPILAAKNWVRLLEQIGFWRRELSSVVGCGTRIGNAQQLFLLHGDRES